MATAANLLMLRRLVLGVAVLLALCAATARPAEAGLLPTCDVPVSQPFKQWGDEARYALVPGGSFEPGSAPWTLSGGAKVVDGNESFYVRSGGGKGAALPPPRGSGGAPGSLLLFR